MFGRGRRCAVAGVGRKLPDRVVRVRSALLRGRRPAPANPRRPTRTFRDRGGTADSAPPRRWLEIPLRLRLPALAWGAARRGRVGDGVYAWPYHTSRRIRLKLWAVGPFMGCVARKSARGTTSSGVFTHSLSTPKTPVLSAASCPLTTVH